jgi:hypothetical protein
MKQLTNPQNLEVEIDFSVQKQFECHCLSKDI